MSGKIVRKLRKVKFRFLGSHFTFDDESGHREVRHSQVFEVSEAVANRASFRSMVKNKGLERVE